jgi:UDP-N-acetylmuramyl pentapeptide phosphotransferase/UDP-N-acetylglucosamine-1-phosphate transferase
MAESRSGPFGFLVFLAIASGAFWAWRTERRHSSAALAALLPVQLFCTLALSEARAKQLIVFMGDGGCLLLGTLLMLTVYAPEDSALKRGWLRWGFLVIGAAAFADAFAQWWASRTDFDRIPFGMNEGAGLSDPSVLSQTYGWSTDQIVSRYVTLGCACLIVLALAYVVGRLRGSKS